MPLAAIAAIGAIGGVATSAIGAHAAGKAADTQANAALQAAQLQTQQEQKALDWQKYVYGNNLQLSSPYVQAGWGATANLANLLGVLPKDATYNPNSLNPASAPNLTATALPGSGGPGWSGGSPRGGPNMRLAISPDEMRGNLNNGQPWPAVTPGTPGTPATGAPSGPINLSTLVNPDLGASGDLMKGFDEKFTAPTGLTEQNDPGFQARLKLGQDVLERSAAAKGNLLTGGFAKDLSNYGQDYASNEYGNVYGRAFNEYAQRYNIFNQDQTNRYNRLANLAGLGQTSTTQLGLMGQNSANNIGSILLGSGAQIGGDLQNAAAARASGYIGSANAINGGIGGVTNSLTNYLMLKNLLGGGSSSSGMI